MVGRDVHVSSGRQPCSGEPDCGLKAEAHVLDAVPSIGDNRRVSTADLHEAEVESRYEAAFCGRARHRAAGHARAGQPWSRLDADRIAGVGLADPDRS